MSVDPQDGRVLYAGGQDGLYKSLDSGEIWRRTWAEGNALAVAVDFRDSRTVYLGGAAGVHKSLDGGQTWQQVKSGLAAGVLAIDPQNSQVVYAGGEGGLFRSPDGGQSWQALLAQTPIRVVAIAPGNSQVVYAGGGTGLYKSADSGATWTQLSAGDFQLLAIAPDDQQLLYVVAQLGRITAVFKSTDGGMTWVQRGIRQVQHHALVADPLDPRTLYAANWQGVFKSTDRAETWTKLPVGEGMALTLALDPGQPQRIYAGTRGWGGNGDVFFSHFLRSEDAGQTWRYPLLHIPVFSLAQDPQDPQVLYAGADQGVYRSEDAGQTWAQVNSTHRFHALLADPLDPHRLLGGGHGLFQSEDQGRTWAPIPAMAYRLVSALFAHPRQPARIYAIASGAIFESPDLFLPPASLPILYAATEWGLCRIDLPGVPGPAEEEEGSTGTTQYNWTSTGPSAILYGGFNLGIAVSTLAVDPQDPRILYAGTASGRIFKRASDGTWSQIGTGLPGTAILDLAVNPQHGQQAYAGVEGKPAIYRTEDGGQSWQPASGNSLFGSVHAVAFDPQNPQVLYGAMNTVLVKTQDGGQRWEKLLAAPAQFSAIAIDPIDSQALYASARNPSTVYGEGGPWEGGVYKSTDGGARWQRVMEGSAVEVVLDARDPKTLYALTEEAEWTPWLVPARNKVYKSEDGGQHWEKLDTDLLGNSIEVLTIDPQRQGALYSAARGRIFESTDGGQTWADVRTDLPQTPVYAMAIGTGDPRRLFAATGHGVYSNENLHNPALEKAEFPLPDTEVAAGTSTWTPSGVQAPVHDLAIAPSDPRIMYAVAGGKAARDVWLHDLYKRTSDGRWVLVGSEVVSGYSHGVGAVSGFLMADPHDSEILYSNGVRRSGDGGKTWTRTTLRSWDVHGYAAAIDPRHPQVMYVGGQGYLEKSIDGGKRWSNATPHGYPEVLFGSLAIDPRQPQTLYAGSVDARLPGLFKSEKGGRNWRQMTVGRVDKLALDWQDSQQIYALIDNRVYHSDDEGEHWHPLPVDLESKPITALALDWQHSGTLYVAASGQVYKSIDQGAHWAAMGTGLPDTPINVLAVDPLHPQVVYAGTARGLYSTGGPKVVTDTTGSTSPGATTPADTAGGEARSGGTTAPTDTTGSNGDEPALPTTTALGQNFPNPFNLQTTIPYQLATPGVVRLEIFDIQGHRVRMLGEGLQPSGFYQLIWNRRDDRGQQLASGVYLVRMEVGDYSAVHKILLLK
jgi:photosystem II stability/assembly factor-like uncharacterized protein